MKKDGKKTNAMKKPYDSPQAQSLKTQVDDFAKRVAESAEHTIAEELPKKIAHLTEMLEAKGGLFDLSTAMPPISKPSVTASNKKRKTPECDGAMEDGDVVVSDVAFGLNPLVVAQQEALKTEADDLMEMMDKIKLWVQLNIPRIEDGNNFGVGIQEDTVHELSRVEDSGFGMFEHFSKYHITRGKLVSRLLKYPNSEDALRSIVTVDDKERRNMRLSLMEIRNNYCIVYDIIFKNFERLKTPRTSNHVETMF